MAPNLADRPAVRRGDLSTLDALVAQRVATEDRDEALRVGLRAWAKAVYGSVDKFAVVLHERIGVGPAHARQALYHAKSERVLSAAVEIYREWRGAHASAPDPLAGVAAAA